jgi:hypothetical protein
MSPVDTVTGMGGEGIKENDGGGEFNHDKLKELLKMSQCTPSTRKMMKKRKLQLSCENA